MRFRFPIIKKKEIKIIFLLKVIVKYPTTVIYFRSILSVNCKAVGDWYMALPIVHHLSFNCKAVGDWYMALPIVHHLSFNCKAVGDWYMALPIVHHLSFNCKAVGDWYMALPIVHHLSIEVNSIQLYVIKFNFNLILYLNHEDHIQPEATSSTPQHR